MMRKQSMLHFKNARLNEAAEIRKLRTYYDEFRGVGRRIRCGTIRNQTHDTEPTDRKSGGRKKVSGYDKAKYGISAILGNHRRTETYTAD